LSGHFEAKKIAWRQTKDGLVLALAVHPDEMPKEMALSPLNTRYMIGFAEIGDDEKPVGLGQRQAALAASGSTNGPQPQGEREGLDSASTSSSEPASGSKKHWVDYTNAQQAAILCDDPAFQRYFGAKDKEDTAQKLREHFHINSRADLDKYPSAQVQWQEFVALYHLHRDRLR
jgi:hypothetical protein